MRCQQAEVKQWATGRKHLGEERWVCSELFQYSLSDQLFFMGVQGILKGFSYWQHIGSQLWIGTVHISAHSLPSSTLKSVPGVETQYLAARESCSFLPQG
jgi:hypothetical protein